MQMFLTTNLKRDWSTYCNLKRDWSTSFVENEDESKRKPNLHHSLHTTAASHTTAEHNPSSLFNKEVEI